MKHLLLFVLIILTTAAFAQAQYTFVFLHKKADAEKLSPEKTKEIMDGHMANMNRLAKEGRLLAAGPFDGGGGIFIMNSGSIDEVKEWISTDPGIQAKRWSIELLGYTPRYGGVCPVGEEYEMTSYSFVRFTPLIEKFTASSYPEIEKKHDDYLKELTKGGNVVTEAVFGKDEGGIIIMKGDVTPEVFENDPGVKEGLLQLDFKKLYIAKGSFCEKFF